MSIERFADTLGGNVVSLFTRKPPVTFAAVREVEAYWEALRGTRQMPARAEIDPRGIAGALEFAFLLERIAPGAGRIRLAGSHLTDLMGMEVRGMPLTALFQPTARQTVADALEQVLQRPSVMVLDIDGERGIGRGKLVGQMLLCPLKSDLGDPSRVLGCLQTDGPVGRAPRRFEVTGQTERLIRVAGGDEEPASQAAPGERSGDRSGGATVPRGAGVPAPAPVTGSVHGGTGVPGLSEGAAPFAAPETAPRSGRPNLRLVKSDSDDVAR